MPAVNVEDLTSLPRIVLPEGDRLRVRPAVNVVDAPSMLEGAGFEVRRAFAAIDL